MKRSHIKTHLDDNIKACRKCEGLNIENLTESAPGYGNINSPIFFIGQSLCTACMYTQIPFTGGSGFLLDDVFEFIQIPKSEFFITNLVHCHPPNNRISKAEEIENCLPFLKKELSIVKPLLIIGFGRDVKNIFYPKLAWNTVVKNADIYGHKCDFASVYHPAFAWRKGNRYGEESRKYKKLLITLIRRYV